MKELKINLKKTVILLVRSICSSHKMKIQIEMKITVWAINRLEETGCRSILQKVLVLVNKSKFTMIRVKLKIATNKWINWLVLIAVVHLINFHLTNYTKEERWPREIHLRECKFVFLIKSKWKVNSSSLMNRMQNNHSSQVSTTDKINLILYLKLIYIH
jgi:hypothetical protein